jgi:hypothetical protein
VTGQRPDCGEQSVASRRGQEPFRTEAIKRVSTAGWSRDSSVGIATDHGLDDQEEREFESR